MSVVAIIVAADVAVHDHLFSHVGTVGRMHPRPQSFLIGLYWLTVIRNATDAEIRVGTGCDRYLIYLDVHAFNEDAFCR